MHKSRLGVAAGVAVLAVLGLSAPAFAHVTVASEGAAAKGGYTVIDFKVPNERDNASTTKLEVTFPYDTHPLASVQPESVPGWTTKITKTKLAKPLTSDDGKVTEAVSKVTWTADGKGIAPGYFQKFPVSVGQLPTNTDELTFKALQTYSDHTVVRWIEPKVKGEPEPENPAPALELSPAQDDSAAAGATGANGTGGSPADNAPPQAAADSGGSDTTARVLGIVGIVIGAAGVGYGVLAGRRRTATGTNTGTSSTSDTSS